MKILYSSCIENPKDVYFDGEDNDEKIILALRRHFVTNVPWVVVAVLMLSAPSFIKDFLEFNNIAALQNLPPTYIFIIDIAWYIFTFGFIFTSFLGWYFHVFLVTNKRLVDIDFIGLTHRRFSEAFLFNVEDLTHQISGAAQVIFNFGTLHVQTAGELRELEFEDVPKPARVQDVISDLSASIKRRGIHDD